jgi:hypothetical protein
MTLTSPLPKRGGEFVSRAVHPINILAGQLARDRSSTTQKLTFIGPNIAARTAAGAAC